MLAEVTTHSEKYGVSGLAKAIVLASSLRNVANSMRIRSNCNSGPNGASGGKAAEYPATTEPGAIQIMTAPLPPPKMERSRPKLHVCRTCDRSFARLEHLKRHVRSHTKEKPFSCPYCARCFTRRDLLLRHQRKLHQTIATSLTPCREQQTAITGWPLNGAGPLRAAETTWKSTVSSSTSETSDSSRGANRSRGNDQPQMGHVGGTNLGAFSELLWAQDTLSVVDGVSYPDHSPHIRLDEACMFDNETMTTKLATGWRSYSPPAFAAHAWHDWSGLQAAFSREHGYDQFEQKKAFASSSSTATSDQTHCLRANFVADGAARKPPLPSSSLHLPTLNPLDADICRSVGLQNSTGFYSTNEATADGSWSPTVGAICQSGFRNRIQDRSGNPTLAAMWPDPSEASFEDTYLLCL